MNRTEIQKWTAAVLALAVLLSLAGCGKEPEPTETLPPAVTTVPETTAPVETTEAVTEPAETEPSEERFVLTFVGDCTLGGPVDHQYTDGGFVRVVGEDYEYPFRNVREYFENDDFTMINFEGVLGEEGYAANKTFTFRGSAEYTEILTSSSVEAVTLANNHSMDYGYAGYDETKRLLEEVSIPYVEKDSSTLFVTSSGLTIGLYAAAFVIDQEDLEAEVAALREQGAEIVVFAVHWGVEGSYTAYIEHTKAARRIIDAGVDIVYGHHPHVLQRIEEYNGGIIMHSLGNFCFGGNQQPADLDTVLVQQEVIRAADGSISLGELTLVPCSISSIPIQNNYQPTPYAEGSPEYLRVLSKLDGTYNGRNLAVEYAPEATESPEQSVPEEDTPAEPPAGDGETESGGEQPPAETPGETPVTPPTPDPVPDPEPET